MKRAAAAAAQALVIIGILFWMLDGFHRDFHVPIHFSADSLEYLMQTKGTLENGWWWVHPRLGAPGSFSEVAYPSNTSVDQAVVWMLRWFTRDAALALNTAWMLLVAASGVIATWGFRRLGLGRWTGVVLGILYACSPYALYRNIEHFSLVTYLVPIPCVAALLLATGRLPRAGSRDWWILAGGCALLGFDYTYYAFFGVFVLLAGAGIGLANGWRRQAVGGALVLAATVSLATAINLAPSYFTWMREGRSLVVPEKTAAESEMYRLKIRQLVSPVLDQTWTPLKAWNTREVRARFPLETENATSRLGLLATIGFLALVAIAIAPSLLGDRSRALDARSAAGVTMALVLLGTVGGFGSIISLLATPEIRSYNRVYPFVAFFSWLTLGWLLESRMASRAWRPVLLGAVLVAGLYDQGHAAVPLDRAYLDNQREMTELRTFVSSLESRVDAGAMVFQLPVTTFLNDNGDRGMRPYDEIKPYVVSSRVHWSYPALENAAVRWQHAVGRLPPSAMAAALQAAGFRAIVIDRHGYPDEGAAVQAALTRTAGARAILAETPRYVAIDLGAADARADLAALPAWSAAFAPAGDGLPACSVTSAGTGSITAHLDLIAGVKVPVAAAVSVSAGHDLELRGWAVDAAAGTLAGDVDVRIDDHDYPSYYGVDRPDVVLRLGLPAYRDSGFVAIIPSASVGPGPHPIALRVLSADRRCVAMVPGGTVVR